MVTKLLWVCTYVGATLFLRAKKEQRGRERGRPEERPGTCTYDTYLHSKVLLQTRLGSCRSASYCMNASFSLRRKAISWGLKQQSGQSQNVHTKYASGDLPPLCTHVLKLYGRAAWLCPVISQQTFIGTYIPPYIHMYIDSMVCILNVKAWYTWIICVTKKPVNCRAMKSFYHHMYQDNGKFFLGLHSVAFIQ